MAKKAAAKKPAVKKTGATGAPGAKSVAPKKAAPSKASAAKGASPKKAEPVKAKKAIPAPIELTPKKPTVAPEKMKKAMKEVAAASAGAKTSGKAVTKAKVTPQALSSEGKAAAKPVAKVSNGSSENVSKDDVHPQWYEFYRKHHQSPAQTYDMKSQFESQAPLMHKVLGWGWIVSNDNDRLEVLFKDGKRMLISNYKTT